MMSKAKLCQLLRKKSQKLTPCRKCRGSSHTGEREYTTKGYTFTKKGDEIAQDTRVYVGNMCFLTHRELLCENSEYFKALFSFEGFTEGETKDVEFSGRTPTSNAFTAFLDFVYKKNFACHDSGVLEFLLAADFLQLSPTFMTRLSRTVTKENWAALLELAVTFECERLEQAVYKFIESHIYQLCRTQTFKKMKKRYKKLQIILDTKSHSYNSAIRTDCIWDNYMRVNVQSQLTNESTLYCHL